MGRLLEVKTGTGVESRAFVFKGEGYTLGNALKYVISQYPEVTVFGPALEHIADNQMLFTIQTKGGNAIEVLRRGLEDLEKICDHTLETFDKAYENFKSSQDTPMDTT